MTFLIAAAGTGGHVYPGLAVGEALIRRGVDRLDVTFVGGTRLEASVYPEAGFPFLELDLRGLKRSFTLENLALPRVVWRARNVIADAIVDRSIGVCLGMGGYVTVPTALAARKQSTPLMVSEQNAGAGLANRVAARWAVRSFGSFPETDGLPHAEWVGNPIRIELTDFDRGEMRPVALDRYGLSDTTPTLGVFGGSLGAGAINMAVSGMVNDWRGGPIQVLHMTGPAQLEAMRTADSGPEVTWRRVGFEDRMDMFYAASDLVVARAGGAVAELAATRMPSILVPGEFGSTGHQPANAGFFADGGASVIVLEADLGDLSTTVESLLFDPDRLATMAMAAGELARPESADVIARALIEEVR